MKKRNLRTTAFSALGALISLMLAACFPGFGGDSAYKDIEGYSEVAEAKKLYIGLDSGHFYMQDNSTGEITSEFLFKYRDDGKLAYFCMSREKDTEAYEYHNGSEINRKNKGDAHWQFIAQGSEDYYVYDRKNRHPYTNDGVISMNAYAVTDSKVEENDSGKRITFYYNCEEFKEAMSELGELKSFECSIWLDKNGYCYRLDQKGVFDNVGEESVSDYSMFIDKMNEIEGDIKRPEV